MRLFDDVFIRQIIVGIMARAQQKCMQNNHHQMILSSKNKMKMRQEATYLFIYYVLK